MVNRLTDIKEEYPDRRKETLLEHITIVKIDTLREELRTEIWEAAVEHAKVDHVVREWVETLREASECEDMSTLGVDSEDMILLKSKFLLEVRDRLKLKTIANPYFNQLQVLKRRLRMIRSHRYLYN